MRKPRSTVYVRPGKDVTLYVPSDTPQEVCDYLNSLKEQGMFSSGVIDIVTEYVQNNLKMKANDTGADELAGVKVSSQPIDVNLVHTEPLYSVANYSDDEVETSPISEVRAAVKRRLSLSEIFNQAQKNSLDKP